MSGIESDPPAHEARHGRGLGILALGIGVFALLLDFTGWYTIAGAVLALVGAGYALLSSRGRFRIIAVSVNGLALVVAAAIMLAFYL